MKTPHFLQALLFRLGLSETPEASPDPIIIEVDRRDAQRKASSIEISAAETSYTATPFYLDRPRPSRPLFPWHHHKGQAHASQRRRSRRR